MKTILAPDLGGVELHTDGSATIRYSNGVEELWTRELLLNAGAASAACGSKLLPENCTCLGCEITTAVRRQKKYIRRSCTFCGGHGAIPDGLSTALVPCPRCR